MDISAAVSDTSFAQTTDAHTDNGTGWKSVGKTIEQVAGAETGHVKPERDEKLPDTIYRKHIEQCDLPENSFTFDFMSDYLSMMDILAKSITHRLNESCSLTPLQYRIMLRLLCTDSLHTKQLSEDLHMGMSTISVAVSKLAASDLVDRRDSATDMRSVELSLTEKGRVVVKRADDAVFETMSYYWKSLTPEQFEAAMKSSASAVSRHSHPRVENGEQRMDTALVDTVMISRSITGHALDKVGLTIGDYRVMLALKIMGNKCSGADISKFLFLHSSDITSCLKNLEARGYITRKRDEENRRMRIVKLTSEGQKRLTELLPVVFDALHETCHSDDELIRIHISAARDLVARKRNRGDF